MSVELDPPDLGFHRPFTQEVNETLTLKNPNHEPIAFKVKTTAPRQYCVRPNSGRIEPGQQVGVHVLLQAMKEDPPPDARCRDKFLVQSVPVPADKEFTSVSQIWQHVEQTSKHLIQERKIRVLFLPASNSAHTPPNPKTNGSYADDTSTSSPPAYDSPATALGTPSRSVASSAKPHNPTEKPRTLGDNDTSQTIRASAANTAAAVTNAIPKSTDELKAELAKAQAKIAELTQSASEGLRQRNVPASVKNAGEAVTTQVQQASSEGVPLQVVAALCLLSFLIAYIFF